MDKNRMQGTDAGESPVFLNFQELADQLDTSVISPLEDMEMNLPKAWEDKASDVFLSRLAFHREILESIRKKLLLIARQQ